MEKFSLDKVTLSTVLDTRRVKDNLAFPVKYRVTFMRKQSYYASGIDLTEEQWEALDNTKKHDLIDLRELITIGFDKVKMHIKDLVKGDGFTFEGLNARLSRGMKNSIGSEFSNKVERLKKEGKVTTASSYTCAIRSIQTFTSKDIKFSDITVDWLKKYEAYLIKKERSLATIRIYMICLRSILNDGKSNGYISSAQYPFGKDLYMIRKGTGRKMALTLSQIDKILKYQLPTEEGRKYRDLWYFSFLCT